jgi:hypothetical protein
VCWRTPLRRCVPCFVRAGDAVLTSRASPQLLQTLVDIRPDPELFREFVDRVQCSSSVQVGPEYSEHEARPRVAQLLLLPSPHGVGSS